MARRQDTKPPDRVTITPTKHDYDFKTARTDVPLLKRLEDWRADGRIRPNLRK
jgi:hypothetical protein